MPIGSASQARHHSPFRDMIPRNILDIIVLVELCCWVVCFWWMHRISSRQNAVLEQLRSQSTRIERVSSEGHELVKELHPAVQNIEKIVEDRTNAAS